MKKKEIAKFAIQTLINLLAAILTDTSSDSSSCSLKSISPEQIFWWTVSLKELFLSMLMIKRAAIMRSEAEKIAMILFLLSFVISVAP